MTAAPRLVGLAAAVLGVACAGCAPLPPGSATSVAMGHVAEERVLVGSMAVVDAVAVSRRFVFAAGAGGIAVYDRAAERYLSSASRDLDRELGREFAPLSAMDAQSVGAPITALAGDPFDDALWIGVPGGVITYRPLTGQVQRTIVSGVPQRIVFDRGGNGEALVQSGGQWTRVSRLGLAAPTGAPTATQVVIPPTLGDLLQRYPGLRAQTQMLVRRASVNGGSANRSPAGFALLSGAASPDRTNEVWLGTDGDGLVHVDPVFGQGATMPYGLLDPGAGALAPAADGVWVGGLGLSPRRGGLTFATVDLARWRWIDGTLAVPLAGVRTFALATRGSRAFMGTDRGLVRVPLDSTDGMQQFTRLRGLPDDRVFAVVPVGQGVWAGTARGLVFVADSLGVPDESLLNDVPIYALQRTGAVLWAGTDRGLVTLPAAAGVGAPTVADAPRPVAGDDPALRRPVRALTAIDSVLLSATDDAVLQFDPRAVAHGVAVSRVDALDPRRVGEVTRLAADERAYALAGRDGLVLLSRATGARRELRVPFDIPAPVFDVLLQRDFVFLATSQGLLRYRRTGDGLVP